MRETILIMMQQYRQNNKDNKNGELTQQISSVEKHTEPTYLFVRLACICGLINTMYVSNVTKAIQT